MLQKYCSSTCWKYFRTCYLKALIFKPCRNSATQVHKQCSLNLTLQVAKMNVTHIQYSLCSVSFQKCDTKMCGSSQTSEPAPPRQKASRKWNWSPLASLEKYFVGFTVRSYPWTYRFCFSWLADVDCVMPLLSQTDLGMVKYAKARNAKCS